jgi:tRNA (adenine58-N1)-methyltransferase non-catalytic subunit
MEKPADNIQIGDYLIVQRQKFTKLYKFNSLDNTIILGKDQLELRNVVGHPYYTSFRMIYKESSKRRMYSLEPCNEKTSIKEADVSGTDNRHLIDDGQSQILKPDEILQLRETTMGAKAIVEHLVENSKTFAIKTEFSQEKYIKRKEKKYADNVQIRRPSIRILAEMYYRQDPDKVLGIRMDSLSQIISYSGITSNGNYLLYESGSNGLLPAAFLNSIGANTEAKIIHLHPGNVSQKQAMLALNLPDEQAERCISVNIYSVLRHYYQETTATTEAVASNNDKVEVIAEESTKRKLSTESEEPENASKLLKTDDAKIKVIQEQRKAHAEKQKQKWMLENETACEILRGKMDCLVIAAREHPQNILNALVPLINPSRPVVVFSQSREVLMECYVELKASNSITALRLTSNWLRNYQILPMRTHPDVNRSGNSGYLLYGITTKQ